MTISILGAGLAGLSCSHFIGHDRCLVFERNSHVGGHIATHKRHGYHWDEGPHVSFTKHQKVKDLLTTGTAGGLLEYIAEVGNWYEGHWIPHPAQSHLHAIPKPLADRCLEDFLHSRTEREADPLKPPAHYGEWLERAFGTTFAQTFPAAYTRKYWTCSPEQLAVDWVGERVYQPDVQTVKDGYNQAPRGNTHYITSVRYPNEGGFESIAAGIKKNCRVRFDHDVTSIDMEDKVIRFANGAQHEFEKLISTIPLDQLVSRIKGVPHEIRQACKELSCSSLLLVNIESDSLSDEPYHWLYVYDEDMYSTRITQTHLLSPGNIPAGKAGIQVEVYASRYRPFHESHEAIATKVLQEVQRMGLVREPLAVHTQFVPYANIICDLARRQCLNQVLSWLESVGLEREQGDLEPMTDWNQRPASPVNPKLALAGRFAQWKYFWTDDCILRGEQLSNAFL